MRMLPSKGLKKEICTLFNNITMKAVLLGTQRDVQIKTRHVLCRNREMTERILLLYFKLI